jgi:hypothetical protein
VGLACQSSRFAWQARCGSNGFQAARVMVRREHPQPLNPPCAGWLSENRGVESKLPNHPKSHFWIQTSVSHRSRVPFIRKRRAREIRTAMALKDNLELLFYVVAWYVGNTFYNIVSDRHPDQDGVSRDPVTACILAAGRRTDSPHLSGAKSAPCYHCNANAKHPDDSTTRRLST